MSPLFLSLISKDFKRKRNSRMLLLHGFELINLVSKLDIYIGKLILPLLLNQIILVSEPLLGA